MPNKIISLVANDGLTKFDVPYSDNGDGTFSPLVESDIHGNTVIVTVTPTLTVHATYVSGDYVGESAVPMSFANSARVNGGSGIIVSAVLVNGNGGTTSGELWLFDGTITPPADSAAWTITDAEALKCIGVIPFSTFYASAANSVSPVINLSIPFKCGSASSTIFGCFVTRGAPTYASGDLSFRLCILQD